MRSVPLAVAGGLGAARSASSQSAVGRNFSDILIILSSYNSKINAQSYRGILLFEGGLWFFFICSIRFCSHRPQSVCHHLYYVVVYNRTFFHK